MLRLNLILVSKRDPIGEYRKESYNPPPPPPPPPIDRYDPVTQGDIYIKSLFMYDTRPYKNNSL